MKKHAKKIITALLVIAMLVPTVAMLYSSAANSYTVELAFENIFVFEQWASNKSSTRITSDGGGGEKDGTLSDIDIEEGSFRLTNNITTAGIYTTASMGTGDAAKENAGFYSMAVEEGASYTFAYNVNGTLPGFYPYVFFYDESGEFKDLTMTPAAGYGDNNYLFTVPEGITHIQVRFTVPNGSASVYGDVKDIAIYKTETVLGSTDLFDFSSWSTKAGSGGGISVYNAGTTSINSDEQSITLTSNGTDNLGGCSSLLTNFALGAYNNTHFVIDTEPGKKYTLSYNLSATTLASTKNLMALIPWYDSSNTWMSSYGQNESSSLGTNTYTFIVPNDVYHFQIVFGLYDYSITNGVYATISDIELREVNTVDHKIDPTRKTYTYSGNGATYGELPTPSANLIPEGQIFAGWYTGKDGTGMRIAADTEIQPMSYTVYPKYEPAVDTLTVKTPPAKVTYTVGEKLNTTGLVLTYGINTQEDTDGDGTTETVTKTTDISTGYYCTPEYLTATGEQTITVHYGGKTATFTVTVTDGDEKNIIVNGAAYPVKVANNEYTLNYTASAFNRYEMTYFSDSYVKGTITTSDGASEDFFLEPSDNGSFASYIDNFLTGTTYNYIEKIKFTCLNKEFGNFELLSLTTINSPVPSNPTQYYENDEYKVGIDLEFGGVVSHIEDLKETDKGKVTARVYDNGDGTSKTLVDYSSKLDSGHLQESTSVNLINTNDPGRYLQQSYYGTADKPYEMGDYNGNPWNYNPVQGGNLESTVTGNGGEASKIIDYRITDDQIYIKTRPLDWGKNSVDYPDSYITDSYMEAWYVFEDGMIKTYCRFVDYSGYPSNTTTQEMPALYTIEPLNHFVYNNVDEAWTETNYEKIEEPEFWGILPEYNALLQANGISAVNPDRVAVENWAAFMASNDTDSFGIGVYSPGVTDMHFGTYPAIYNEEQVKNGQLVENYRHAQTTDPAKEPYTSYISPVDIMTFESYKPFEYSFYITTGTADEIHDDFEKVAKADNEAELAKSKIAVPETVYMTPADGASTIGQYYVNNVMDESNNNIITTEAVRDAGMYFGLHVENAKEFSVKVTNVTDPSNDIYFCNSSGSEIGENTRIAFGAAGTYTDNHSYGMRFSGAGLAPGEKATAKWEITVYFEDGSTETYTAYTVMYAPGRTVGAVAEARQNNNLQNEISSWITGANGIDHSQRAPLGSFHGDVHDSGYFREDPLIYGDTPMTGDPAGGAPENPHDYIITTNPSSQNNHDTADDYTENAYVLQTATLDSDSSRSQSYLGLLTVDKSRYSNTNQIPNLRIGYDALRVGSGSPEDSLDSYDTYYTLGTESAFTSSDLSDTPSGWTTHESYDELENSESIPYRTSLVPAYNVSDLDGKYIHAIARGHAYTLFVGSKYSTAGTSVLCSVTDKGELRDSVLNGYTMVEDDPEFVEALEKAATVLGDPSASQEDIDNAKKDLNNAMEELVEKFYALKYDNLFSAYEFSQHAPNMTMSQAASSSVSYSAGTLTVTNETMTAGETYTRYGSSSDYYNIPISPNTTYIFEYDVTTTTASQAFLFFYNSSGGNGDVATSIAVQTDRNGTWASKTESNPWIGNYQGTAGTKHYAIKFTTGANTTSVGFRFGNTSSNATTSTFSNIRLIDADRYYADVEYAKTEDVYKEYASYGTLPTLTRTGYTFGGWVDAAGNTVTGADIATEHKSIFSVWTENRYTIVYNANGGSGSTASQTVTYTQSVTLDAGTNFSKSDSKLIGWATTSNATSAQYKLGQTVSGLTNVNNGTVTLYAVWASAEVNITFDNLIDFKSWNKTTASNGTISDITDTGFTLTTKTGAGEGTSESPEFPVTGGKQYMIDIDFVGDGWDVYIFFRNTTQGGTGINFNDGTNRFSSNGTGNASQIFTAPASATKAVIRLDSNGSGNIVSYNNIRVYEYDGISPIEVDTANKIVNGGSTFGDLPTPTKEGFTFLGWFDENGNQVTAASIVNDTDSNGVVPLTSKWQLADTALGNDSAVIDFGTSLAIDTDANDTIFNKAATAYGATGSILGISTDGSSYASTANGSYGTFKLENGNIVYTPTSAINDAETVYYRAQLSSGDTTVVKSKLTVAPASNILYEETLFQVNTAVAGVDWKTDGTPGTSNQDASTTNDVYGYDSNVDGYNKIANYSNGSAYKVSVDETNKRSKIMSFTFTGEGFDLNSACGPNTGVQIVTLKDNTNNKMVKSYIVDTYYSDANYGDADSKILYQVPIISENALEYSNYTIQVIASWLPSMSGALNAKVESQAVESIEGMTVNTAAVADSTTLREALAEVGLEYVLDAEAVDVVWFDDNSVLNGGMGIDTLGEDTLRTAAVTSLLNVVDSVRVYKPIENGNSYYIPSEANAQYINVMDNLVNPTEDGAITGSGNYFAYISGKTDEEDIVLDTYKEIGPKDELYLSKAPADERAITFTIKDFDNATAVMISLRAASGTPTVKIGSYQFAVKSNTEMYYDITDYIAADGTVTIQNVTDSSLLAVGSLKITSEVVGTAALSTEFNLMTARTMMMAVAEDVEPNAPDAEPEEPVIPEEPVNPEEPSTDDDSSECWLIRFFKWVIEMFVNIFNFVKGIFGF